MRMRWYPRPSSCQRRPSFACCVVLAATLTIGSASDKDNTVKLTKFNFDKNIRQGAWFVKFFAPWCTHCQRLAPIWEKLAEQATAGDWPVKIAEVDCTTAKEVCEQVQVKAFPTLALISEGKLQGKYQGEASVSHFEDWLNDQGVMSASRKTMTGTPLDFEATKGPKPTMSHAAAAGAVLGNIVSGFPTKSKIINIYFYGGILLVGLVALLTALFKFAGPEEEEEEDHDKMN